MTIASKFEALEASIEAFFSHASSLSNDLKELKEFLGVASTVAGVIAPAGVAEAVAVAENVVGAISEALNSTAAPAVQPEDTTPQTIGS